MYGIRLRYGYFLYTKTEGFSDDESPSVLFVYRKILICSGKSPGIAKQFPEDKMI